MRPPTSLTRSGYGRWAVVSQFLEVSAAGDCARTPTREDHAASSSVLPPLARTSSSVRGFIRNAAVRRGEDWHSRAATLVTLVWVARILLVMKADAHSCRGSRGGC